MRVSDLRRALVRPLLGKVLTSVWVVALAMAAGCGGSGKDPDAANPKNDAERKIVSLGAKIRNVDGERHVILTKWKGTTKDYALVQEMKDATVLFMANQDVSDETLGYVGGLKKLKELDLNDSSVTDTGLEILMDMDGLKMLHVAGTAVTAAAADKWKAAKPGRKYER